MKYLFRGSVLIPNGQIASEAVHISLPSQVDYPAGELRVEITNNVVIGHFETTDNLTETGAATLRNTVRDVAATLCRCFAVTEGIWATAMVHSVIAEDGSELRFDEISWALKREFEKHGVTAANVIQVTEHPDGYYLRNAIDNVAVGLMEPKFTRAQFCCAVEALRISMAPDKDEGQQWETFRNTLQVTRSLIDSLRDNALRHGNYRDAAPLCSAEMETVLSFLGEIICKYVAWFKRTKLSPPGAQVDRHSGA